MRFSDFKPLSAEFRLKNATAIQCEVTPAFRDQTLKVFSYEPQSLNVAVGGEEALKVVAVPDKRAKFESQLLLSVKNNPKVEAIQLICAGCHVNFVIRPKLVNFDHAIVNQMSRQEIMLENVSDISVFWKIFEVERIPKVLKFSCTKGYMMPAAKQEVFIDYTPCDSHGIPKMIVLIHVRFDWNRYEDFLFVIFIYRCTSYITMM